MAGVFTYLTVDIGDEGPLPPVSGALLAPAQIRIHRDVDLREKDAEFPRLFRLIFNVFKSSGIGITEVQYWGTCAVVVLGDPETDMSKVPRSGASVTCVYFFEYKLDRANSLPARRVIEPTDAITDSTSSDVLRPGVMLSSPEKGASHSTTAGILLEDQKGNRFVSVASNELPRSTEVMHPTHDGRHIGDIALSFPNTGLSLVRLKPGEAFVNGHPESPYQITPPAPLSGFIYSKDIRLRDNIHMNSAIPGWGEGMVVAEAYTCAPNQPAAPADAWIETNWTYHGQGSAQDLVDGTCGSAMWDDNGKVVSFFRYAPRQLPLVDLCQSTACDFLIDGGYKVVSAPWSVSVDRRWC